MRRRPDPDPGGAFLNGIWYPDTSRIEYLVARAAWDERRRARRARLLARIEAERDGLGEDR
jgi:hypothetical protein